MWLDQSLAKSGCWAHSLRVSCLFLLPFLLTHCIGQESAKAKRELVDALIDTRAARQLRDWPTDIPIHPGLKGVAPARYKGTYSLLGSSDADSEVLRSFYKKALAENGWTEQKMASESGVMDSMSFTKEGRRVTVDISHAAGQQTLLILNHWEAGAWRERQPGEERTGSPEARAILDKMADTYATCTSYRDKGTVTTKFFLNHGEAYSKELPFMTAFARPDRFRFEFSSQFPSSRRWYRHIVCSDGANTHVWGDPCKPGVITRDSAIGTFTGISGGSAGTIPFLLFAEEDNFRLTDLSDVVLLPDADLHGIACYRIDGKDLFHDIQSLWIDKSTFLVRQLEERRSFPDFRLEQTTSYSPEINIPLSSSELEFNPPGRLETLAQDTLESGRRFVRQLRKGNPLPIVMASLACLASAGCVAAVQKLRRARRSRAPLPGLAGAQEDSVNTGSGAGDLLCQDTWDSCSLGDVRSRGFWMEPRTALVLGIVFLAAGATLDYFCKGCPSGISVVFCMGGGSLIGVFFVRHAKRKPQIHAGRKEAEAAERLRLDTLMAIFGMIFWAILLCSHLGYRNDFLLLGIFASFGAAVAVICAKGILAYKSMRGIR